MVAEAPQVDLDFVSAIAGYGEGFLVFGAQGGGKDLSYNGIGYWDGQSWQPTTKKKYYGRGTINTLWQGLFVFGGNSPFADDEAHQDQIGSSGLTAFDGTSWRPVSEEFHGYASAVTVWRGELIVAGSFVITGKPELTSVARWDGDAWHPVVGQNFGGGTSRISCLTVFRDQLVAGGTFTEIGGAAVNNIALCDGEKWFSPGAGTDGRVTAVATASDQLYATGEFTCIGGQNIHNLAYWDGHKWSAMTWVPKKSDSYRPLRWARLQPTPEGLFVTGALGSLTGEKGAQYGLWDGKQWLAGLSFQDDSQQLFTEGFSYLGPVLAPPETRDQNGEPPLSEPQAWRKPPPPDPTRRSYPGNRIINAMTWHNDQLFASTHISSGCGNTPREPRLLAWSNKQWRDIQQQPRHPWSLVGQYRHGLLLQSQAKQPDGGLLAWWHDGELTQLAARIPGLRTPRMSLIQTHGDSIFVMGDFEQFADQECRHIVMYDGSGWRALGHGIPFDRVEVSALSVSDAEILVAGRFSNKGCRPINGIMRWDGRSWELVESVEMSDTVLPMVAFAGHIYRAGTDNNGREYLYDPDHQIQSFPAESLPFIEQWTGSKWQNVWQGSTGRVVDFASSKNTLWAALSSGTDANLVRFTGGSWQVVSTTVLPGEKITETNLIRELILFRGVPLVMGSFRSTDDQEHFQQAYWRDGKWHRRAGLKYRSRLVVTDDRLWSHASFENPESGARSLVWTWLEGDLPPGREVVPADLAAMQEFKEVCRASDQSIRPNLDLPWPAGVSKTGREAELHASQQPGWYLSDWPDSLSRPMAEMSADGSTMILNPYVTGSLGFQYHWPKGTPGQACFEYRLVQPDAWRLSETERQNDTPQHPELAGYRTVPQFEFGGSGHRRVRLYPRGESWQTVSVRLKPSGNSYRNRISFSGGLPQQDGGRLEIRNLRFTRETDTRLAAYQANRERLTDYVWPDESQPLRESLLALADSLMTDDATSVHRSPVDSRWWGMENPAGISTSLLCTLGGETPTEKERFQDLVGLVQNLADWRDTEGWIPGGGLYLRTGSPWKSRSFIDLVEDPKKQALVKGVVLDQRYGGMPSAYALDSFRWTNEQLQDLFETETIWCRVQEGKRWTNDAAQSTLLPMIATPGTRTLPDIPIVVLVGRHTPGHVMLMLNAIPAVTTVGRPSGPVIVPSQPFLTPNGLWAYSPAGQVFDQAGRNVSFCRINPDYQVPPNANYDVAVRQAMRIIGIEPDEGGNLCPWR